MNPKPTTKDPIEELFDNLKNKGEKAFIPFLTIGDPSPEVFLEIIKVVAPHADIIELGIPFSDPMADGPVIQKANQRAIKAGMTRTQSFKMIQDIKKMTQKPIVILTYANILGMEPERSVNLKKFAQSGVNGIIAADVPMEEAQPLVADATAAGLDIIFLATPTTQGKRLAKILQMGKGFVYVVSVKGVTGARSQVTQETKETITRIAQARGDKKIPICVGFGLSTPEHVQEIGKLGADGAIVGSAIIQLIENNLADPKTMVQQIGSFAKSLKTATRQI